MAIQIDGDGIGVSALSTSAKAELKSGRKNLIINGGFQVSQRGNYTTATSTSNGVYTLDRYQSLVDTVNVTFQDLGGELKYAATSTATGRFGFQQKIEEYTKLRGKQVTLSAKVTSNTSDVQLMIYDGSTFTSVNHSGNGSEEILTVTGTLSSSASLARAYVFVSNNNLDVSVTTGDYFSVKELQLELGSVATDFEHRSYGEELALCQRYCYVLTSSTTHYRFPLGITHPTLDEALSYLSFPVVMRTRPTLSTSYNRIQISNNGSGDATSVGVSGDGDSEHGVNLKFNFASGAISTHVNAIQYRIVNQTDWTFIFDAEL